MCVFSFFGLTSFYLGVLVPNYSSLQELSNGMFYKGIASTITHIGPQRVTPLGALLFIISLVYFTLWTSKFGYVLSRSTATEGEINFKVLCFVCVCVCVGGGGATFLITIQGGLGACHHMKQLLVQSEANILIGLLNICG